MADKTEIRSQLRMPPGLHKRLTAEAKKRKRSMNAEIIERLEESFTISGDLEEIQRQVEESRGRHESLVGSIDSLRVSTEQYVRQSEKEKSLIRSLANAVLTLGKANDASATGVSIPEAPDHIEQLKNVATKLLHYGEKAAVGHSTPQIAEATSKSPVAGK